MLPHSPGGLSDIAGQIRNAMVAAREVPEAPTDRNGGPAAPAAGGLISGGASAPNSN